MDIFNFITNNSALVILAFGGFLTLSKGIPWLIEYNNARHAKTEEKLEGIEGRIVEHTLQSQNDKNIMTKEMEVIKKSISKIENRQETHREILQKIELSLTTKK